VRNLLKMILLLHLQMICLHFHKLLQVDRR